MSSKISKDVLLLGRVETVVSGVLLALSVLAFFGDLTFHLAGGFLAIIGAGVGIASLLGLIAGLTMLKFKYIGVLFNLLLAGYILYFESPVVKQSLSDLMVDRTLGYTYPEWRFISAVIFLAVAAFLIFFCLKMLFQSTKKYQA